MPETAWSPGFLLTCELFLNGRFLAIAAPPDGNVEYQWRPHRVVRTNGEAFKSSEDAPFIEDWCCIAAGAFTELVIDSIFGAELTLSDGIKVNSHLASFDPSARLEGLRYQGSLYTVTKDGAHPQK